MSGTSATTGAGVRFSWTRIGIGAVVLAGLVVAGRAVGGYVPAFADWVHAQGAWGPAVFIAVYAVAVVAWVPGSLLTLTGGAIFDLAWGTAYVFVGATLGSTLAFLIARYVARDAIAARVARSPRFAAVDRAIGGQGLKIVFLLRLSPVFPFTPMNFALGLTRVRLRDYVLASIGMLPGTVLYVYYGKVAGDVAATAGGVAGRGPADWALLAVGLAATVAVTVVITRAARRALAEELED